MTSQTAPSPELAPITPPEGDLASVSRLIPRADSPFGAAEGQTPPVTPPNNEGPAQAETPPAEPDVSDGPSLVQRGVDGAKRAAETTKAKLSDAEFRGKLIDASVTAARVGYTAVKTSRMLEFNPENGKPRIKPKAAEHAVASPGATAARLSYHLGKAIAKEHGTYEKRQEARKAKS
jgi:hypothetical protein